MNATEGINAVESLYKNLITNLKFNIYELDEEFDVCVAFETMNNRGKPLSLLELLKNRLIYLTTYFSNNLNLRKDISDTWKEIYIWMGKNSYVMLSDDDFLRTHWIIYYRSGQKGSSIDAAKKFLLNDRFSNRDTSNVSEIQAYVHSLRNFVKYYYFTYFPDDTDIDNNFDAEERNMVKRFNNLGIKFLRPLIMISAHKGNCKGKRLELFKAIERFIFVRFCLGEKKSDNGDTNYYDAAKDLNFGIANFESIIDKLLNDTNSDMETSINACINNINSNFINDKGGYYSWKALKYVLYEYEYHLRENNQRDMTPDWDKIYVNKTDEISIEHILPQNIDSQGAFLDSSWASNFAQYNDEEIQLLTGALGNLLLLHKNINSSYQNDSFADKVDPPPHKRASGYRQGTNSEREVVNISKNMSGNWTAQEIKCRTEILVDFIINHWNLDINADQRRALINLDFVNQ